MKGKKISGEAAGLSSSPFHASRADVCEVPGWFHHLPVPHGRGSVEATQLLQVLTAAPAVSRGLVSWRPQGTCLIYWQMVQPTWLFMPLIHVACMGLADVWQPLRVIGEQKQEYSFKFSSGSSALPCAGTLLYPTEWPPNPEGELQPVTLGRNIMLSLFSPAQNFIKPCILAKLILSLSFQNEVCCT